MNLFLSASSPHINRNSSRKNPTCRSRSLEGGPHVMHVIEPNSSSRAQDSASVGETKSPRPKQNSTRPRCEIGSTSSNCQVNVCMTIKALFKYKIYSVRSVLIPLDQNLEKVDVTGGNPYDSLHNESWLIAGVCRRCACQAELQFPPDCRRVRTELRSNR